MVFSPDLPRAHSTPLLHGEKMSRYDDLSLRYATYRSISERVEKIAIELASAVKSSLDAPEGAVFAHAVVWSDGRWIMGPDGGRVSQRHDDGRFYFAVCTRLASPAKQYEPQIFATLLSVLAGGADVEVRLEDTQPKFSVHLTDPRAREDLVGELIGVIEDALDPELSGKPSRPNIGFIAA
jgi:hypothetical protein